MVESAVIESIKNYLRASNERGLPVAYAVLFGAYARNQAHSWSDMDVVVVSERFDEPLRREAVQLLWRVAACVDSQIEPTAAGLRQYESGAGSAIVEIARREGVRSSAALA